MPWMSVLAVNSHDCYHCVIHVLLPHVSLAVFVLQKIDFQTSSSILRRVDSVSGLSVLDMFSHSCYLRVLVALLLHVPLGALGFEITLLLTCVRTKR